MEKPELLLSHQQQQSQIIDFQGRFHHVKFRDTGIKISSSDRWAQSHSVRKRDTWELGCKEESERLLPLYAARSKGKQCERVRTRSKLRLASPASALIRLFSAKA